MKRIERFIINLTVIQLFFLLFFQLIFHREDSFIELKKLAEYEGVYRDNYPRAAEVLEDLPDWNR